MRELDPLISSFTHEKARPREKEALETLQKIASLVKPIMRARNWRVGTLAEFYPAEANLLGLNHNKGQKICLRLRYPGDANQFLPIEQVVDTMLHELSHIIFGPHDAKFHALWDQLREEHEALVRKGYTGEGFLSEGKRLGGRAMPRDEARRIARNAAEKRRTLTSGSGQKLGGTPLRPGQDIRKVIVDAIERRNTVLKGCGVERKNADEIKDLADQATSNGFRTKAEEDKANEQAIAQALWELVQEEEKSKYGAAYVPPTAENPTGNGGGPDSFVPPHVPEATKPPATKKQRAANERQQPAGRPISRLVSMPSSNPKSPKSSPAQASSSSLPNNATPRTVRSRKWICPFCTCHNPESYLCCDACTNQRPSDAEANEWIYDDYSDDNNQKNNDYEPTGIIDLTSSPKQAASATSGVTKRRSPTGAPRTQPKMWTCHFCGNHMEEKWWTCSACGIMKLKS